MYIVALDLETTGLDANNDSIIEVGLVKFDAKTFEIVEKYSTLVNPDIVIPDIITNITNISNNDILDAPYFDEIENKISDFIGDYPILGHNIAFDISFLKTHGIDIDDNISLDTFLLANFLVKDISSLSLESLSIKFKLDLTGAHRALNDTIATVKLFGVLISSINDLAKQNREIISYILSKSSDLGFRFILDNYLGGKNIVDSSLYLKQVVKAFKYRKISSYLKNNLDKRIDYRQSIIDIDNLELRDNQLKMFDLVDQTLIKNNKLAIDAPTGVGKTFAYLLPSIYYSRNKAEQVFVSTSTKALQDQIYYKDLDFLRKNIKIDFSYVKLKGRKNYLGVNSFLRYFNENDYFDKELTSFFIKISFWIFESKCWELDELDFYGREYSFLRNINADTPDTLSKNNEYSSIEPLVVSRKNAKKANIVVINNNLLFQDINGDNSILGKVGNLVIDEAHNLEDVVTSSLKKTFCLSDLEKGLKIIDNIIKKSDFNVNKIAVKSEQLLFNTSTLFDLLFAYLLDNTASDSKYKSLFLDDKFFEDNIDNISNIFSNVKSNILEYLDLLSLTPDEIYLKLSNEIKYINVILEIIETFSASKSNSNYIRILSYDNNKKLSLEYTVLNSGDFLINNIWSKVDSCILTSATLKIGDSFDYINKNLDLRDFKFESLGTDFSYDKQALLYIPNNLGSIKNNIENIVDFLEELFLRVKGKSLVLFTAYYNIKKVYLSLNLSLKKQGINIYAQGIGGGKSKLLDFYKNNYDKSILLGTDTFWEGIDIPGDKLKYLVIHKIPFMVPSDPIFKARSVLYDNPFLEYALPKASLKLKQGFGRLIRTKTDNGIIIFLDDRIYSTGWGEEIYKAFPLNINKKIGNTDALISVLGKVGKTPFKE